MTTEPFLQAEPALADLAKQLEQWHQAHPTAPNRIPVPFWEQAVVLATLLPSSRVSRTNSA